MYSDSNVLLVTDDPAETIVFERILGKHTILKRVPDLRELHDTLPVENRFDAVLCEWSSRKAAWEDVLEQIPQPCPDLPVIVYFRMGTEREWVVVHGGCVMDFLTGPHLERTVLSVLERAVASHQARRLQNCGNGDRREGKLDRKIGERSHPGRSTAGREGFPMEQELLDAVNVYRLFVGNMGSRMSESELRAMVTPFGTVKSIRVVGDSITGISLGYAFVEMTKWGSATWAVSELNGKRIDGHHLVVRPLF